MGGGWYVWWYMDIDLVGWLSSHATCLGVHYSPYTHTSYVCLSFIHSLHFRTSSSCRISLRAARA